METKENRWYFCSAHAELTVVLRGTQSQVIEGKLVPIIPAIMAEFHNHLYNTTNPDIAKRLREYRDCGLLYHEGVNFEHLVTTLRPIVSFGPRGTNMPIQPHEREVLAEQAKEDRDQGTDVSTSTL